MVLRLVVALVSISPVWASTILVSPPSSNVSVGQVFTLAINMNSVTDLYAYQFDLKFDASVLNAVSETEGDFLSLGGPTFFISGTIDNVGGFISGSSDSLESAVLGVSGSGTLVSVSFKAIGAGNSSVQILNDILLDSNLSGIDTSVANGTVSVSAVATPEPSSGALVLVVAASALVFRRRLKVLSNSAREVRRGNG